MKLLYSDAGCYNSVKPKAVVKFSSPIGWIFVQNICAIIVPKGATTMTREEILQLFNDADEETKVLVEQLLIDSQQSSGPQE